MPRSGNLWSSAARIASGSRNLSPPEKLSVREKRYTLAVWEQIRNENLDSVLVNCWHMSLNGT